MCLEGTSQCEAKIWFRFQLWFISGVTWWCLTSDSYGNLGYEYYIWSTVETISKIVVEEGGQYIVTVSNVYGIFICDTEKVITVIESNKASII